MPTASAPTILYHYTSTAGLIGILERSALWASNIHYLNDSKEFHQAIECAQQTLHTESSGLDSAYRENLLQRFRERLEQISQVSILVASLSENGDSLSQWRGYCPPGGGYAVGFNYERLALFANQQGFRLLPCSYSNSEHQALMKPLIQPLLRVEPEGLENALNTFLGQFVQIAPMMKHASFSEEREWRLVSGLFATNRSDWQVRIGRTMLIPYTAFNIGKGVESSLCEAVVGPTPHQTLAGSSVPSALNKAGIKKWTVRYSQSSYRDW